MPEKLWLMFYNGKTTQSQHQRNNIQKPPSSAFIEEMGYKPLIGHYHDGENGGNSLLHAVVQGNLRWNDKKDLIFGLLARAERISLNESVIELLERQHTLGDSTISDNTILHQLVHAWNNQHEDPRLSAKTHISDIIIAITDKAPNLVNIPNARGETVVINRSPDNKSIESCLLYSSKPALPSPLPVFVMESTITSGTDQGKLEQKVLIKEEPSSR